MLIRNLLKAFIPNRTLILTNKQPIISKLFKKKNEQEAIKPPQTKQAQQKEKEKQIEKEDEEYDFFERRKEIDTSFDFSKLRSLSTEIIPEDLGKGGIEQVLYWSQNAKTPEQIREVVAAFNKTAQSNKSQVKKVLGSVHMQQFKQSVLNIAFLADSIKFLGQLALFAYTFEFKNPEYWEKIEFKVLKHFPKNEEEIGELVDIAFMMGQFKVGELIYNHVQQLLLEIPLNIDQCVKLFLTFSHLKVGEKKWIDKLLKCLTEKFNETDVEQFTAVLPCIKDAKSVPHELDGKIQQRTEKLLETMNIHQIITLTHYLGFENQNLELWSKIEDRINIVLKDKKITSSLIIELIHKTMLTYKLSIAFIRGYIINPIQSRIQILEKMRPKTLSALSKGLYIYQLEQQTKQLEKQICKTVISKITQQINEITDEQLVCVIQDYNLSRNGSRQIYIFFEEVIKVKFINQFNAQMNRNTVEKLIEIYENSGMCSKNLYVSLQNLILQ